MASRAQGLRTWLLQRLSALYVAVYLVLALFWFYQNAPVDYMDWQSLFASPMVNIFSQLFIYLLLTHAWIGVRDILIDYVQNIPTRFVLLIGMSLLQLVMAIWVFMAFYAVVAL